jgi:hypothetical protein
MAIEAEVIAAHHRRNLKHVLGADGPFQARIVMSTESALAIKYPVA